MNGTMLGTTVAATGYVMAIFGGWKLYQNAAPDRMFGTIPRTNDIVAFQQEEARQLESRRVGNRVGFGLLTMGAILQLVGTLISGFLS